VLVVGGVVAVGRPGAHPLSHPSLGDRASAALVGELVGHPRVLAAPPLDQLQWERVAGGAPIGQGLAQRAAWELRPGLREPGPGRAALRQPVQQRTRVASGSSPSSSPSWSMNRLSR
jgi:hypothetical protein